MGSGAPRRLRMAYLRPVAKVEGLKRDFESPSQLGGRTAAGPSDEEKAQREDLTEGLGVGAFAKVPSGPATMSSWRLRATLWPRTLRPGQARLAMWQLVDTMSSANSLLPHDRSDAKRMPRAQG